MGNLNKMFLAVLTRDVSDSGTDDPIVLIVNDSNVPGEDLLHATSPFSPSRGKANLFNLAKVAAIRKINPANLTNSSIRVGLRGSDAWQPELLFAWGDQDTNPSMGPQIPVTPLALSTDIRLTLSNDAGEGRISIPLRQVNVGSSSSLFNSLLVIVTTADKRNAGTDDEQVVLQIQDKASNIVLNRRFPASTQDDQRRGRANVYLLDNELNPRLQRDQIHDITLTMLSHDAWLPESFFLFGLDDATPRTMVPLVSLPAWPASWMSADLGEGVAQVTLPRVGV
jgi:hypothetical protein